MTYQWRTGFQSAFKVEPDQARAELMKIREREEILTAETVLNNAANPNSALHPCFEWDDNKAAHRYRLQQANQLLRAIEVVYEDQELPVNAFTLAKPEEGPQQYYPTEYLVSKPDLFADGVKRLRAEMLSAVNSLRRLEQLADTDQKRRKITKVSSSLQRAADGLAKM